VGQDQANHTRVQFSQNTLATHVGKLPEAGVAFPKLEDQFNGTITNDKFCLSRIAKLQLSWRRGPRGR
jgi:hypothetical protein